MFQRYQNLTFTCMMEIIRMIVIIRHYYDCLDDVFIFIVDDWNWKDVRDGTNNSIQTLKLKVLYEKEIRTTNDDTHPQWGSPEQQAWHNGIYVAILQK